MTLDSLFAVQIQQHACGQSQNVYQDEELTTTWCGAQTAKFFRKTVK